jgi:hypothetical protein
MTSQEKGDRYGCVEKTLPIRYNCLVGVVEEKSREGTAAYGLAVPPRAGWLFPTPFVPGVPGVTGGAVPCGLAADGGPERDTTTASLDGTLTGVRRSSTVAAAGVASTIITCPLPSTTATVSTNRLGRPALSSMDKSNVIEPPPVIFRTG